MKGVLLRGLRPSDEGFVIKGWRESYRDAAAVKGADRDHYRDEMARVIAHYCRIGLVRIACSIDDSDQLLGFAVLLPDELVYVYVKQAFRKLGIARQLLEGLTISSYTFLSAQARPPKGWRFTPRWSG